MWRQDLKNEYFLKAVVGTDTWQLTLSRLVALREAVNSNTPSKTPIKMALRF